MVPEVVYLHSPILIIAIPLFAAFATPLIHKLSGKARDCWVIGALVLTEIFILLLAYDVLIRGNLHYYIFGALTPTTFTGAKVPVRIILEIDGLNAFFGAVAGSIALLAGVYSHKFMEKYTGLEKYYTLLLLLSAGMLGMILTGDMFNFFVWLEVTSIAACALVAFWIHFKEPGEAAFKYMLIGSVAALCVLFAVALLYAQYDLLAMGSLAKRMRFGFVEKLALVMLLVPLAMKAGVVPMHMWKPDAFGEAPASISMMLVAVSLACIYAIARVCFTIYSEVISALTIGWILVVLGLLSIFVGVTMAVAQRKLQRMIGYVAIAEIGYMMLALGVGLAGAGNGYAEVALKGGVFHVLNDALDLGLLFLIAGAVFYATKEKNLDNLGGLARNLRYTSVFFLVGLAAIAGLPPTNGFASKLMIYESVYYFNPVLAIIAILASIFMLAIFVKVFYSAFLGPPLARFKQVHEVPRSMLFVMCALVYFIILFGLIPDMVVENLVAPAVKALANPTNYIGAML